MSKTQLSMERGANVLSFAHKFASELPQISVNGGPIPYVWVGGASGPCYATLSGLARLRALRNALTKALRLAAH